MSLPGYDAWKLRAPWDEPGRYEEEDEDEQPIECDNCWEPLSDDDLDGREWASGRPLCVACREAE